MTHIALRQPGSSFAMQHGCSVVFFMTHITMHHTEGGFAVQNRGPVVFS